MPHAIGDRSISSFHQDDQQLMNSPKALRKIEHVWRNSLIDIDLYLYDVGVDPDRALDAVYSNGLISRIRNRKIRNIDLGVEFSPDAISVILTNNAGINRIPLTGWMIAHRLFHTFEVAGKMTNNPMLAHIVNELFDITEDALFRIKSHVNLPNLKLAASIGTTRACRNEALSSPYELVPECFAQYILTGSVRLNSTPETAKIVELLRGYYVDAFDQLLDEARGKVVRL